MNYSRIFRPLVCVLLGGLIFWTPSVLLHWARGNQFSGWDVIALTVGLPITTVLFLFIMRKLLGWSENRVSEFLFAILGIWLLGPLMMFVGESFAGGGFSKLGGWHFVLKGTIFFPVVTFMMSTYDGTLFALLLATALLPFIPTVNSLIYRRLKESASLSNPPVNRL